YMISCIFQRIGDPSTRKRYLILLGDCSDINQARAPEDKASEGASPNGDSPTGAREKAFEGSNPNDQKGAKEKDSTKEEDKLIEVIKVASEFGLNEALCDLIAKHDPDVISGYNI